ncbi:hypothetical protein GGI22_005745, partial [Coemansia erecta]
MSNNSNNNNSYGGGNHRQQHGQYDNAPPTQYLGNGSHGHGQHDNDPYGENAYDDYDRPDSFDVSYYTRDGEDNDNIYMAGTSGHGPGGHHDDGP